jgi:hypothetical protein
MINDNAPPLPAIETHIFRLARSISLYARRRSFWGTGDEPRSFMNFIQPADSEHRFIDRGWDHIYTWEEQ